MKNPNGISQGTIAAHGTVAALLPDAAVQVRLGNGRQVLARAPGGRCYPVPGDRVTVELSPLDLKRGRITAWVR